VTVKSFGDAIALRNRLIEHLEEADTECAANDRQPRLTFVVAGGGFAGVETVGSINDFLKDALPFYPALKPEMLRVVLVHPGDCILPELGEKLGRYAGRKLADRGVELRANVKVKAVTPREVELTDGTRIESFTLVWTAGTSLDWTLDVFFSKDLVQFLHERSPAISDASAASHTHPPAVTPPEPVPVAPNGLDGEREPIRLV
jgi:NADH dehydrogenase FAD-containing subunit